MHKPFSPRSWLHSLYTSSLQHPLKPSFSQPKLPQPPRHIFKKNKLPDSRKSTDGGLKLAYTSRPREENQNEREYGKLVGGREREEGRVFRESNKQERRERRQTEEVNLKETDGKRMTDTQPPRQTRLIRITPQFSTPVAQIILSDSPNLTPTFSSKPLSQQHSLQPSLPMLLRKQTQQSQCLETIREETLEHVRRNTSQLTFQTPKSGEELLISVNETSRSQNPEEDGEPQKKKKQQGLLESRSYQLEQSQDLINSPIKHYSCSSSLPIHQSISHPSSPSNPINLSSLKQLYLQQQQFQKEKSRENLTMSLASQMEGGMDVRLKTYQEMGEMGYSVDRLSPIPVESSVKEELWFASVEEKEERCVEKETPLVFRVFRVENREITGSDLVSMTQEKQNIKEEPCRNPKRIIVHRKLEQSPFFHPQPFPKLYQTQPHDSTSTYHSLKTLNLISSSTNLPSFPSTHILSTSNLRISTQYVSGRSTERSYKGISLSRKSEERSVKRSLEKSSIKMKGNGKDEIKKQGREFLRLGNKIVIRLKQEKDVTKERKGGIQLVTEQRRSKSRTKSIRKKIM